MLDITPFETLAVHTENHGMIVTVELNHGRVNEMGQQQLAEWQHLAEQLEQHQAAVLLTYSTKVTRKGTPIFIAGANVTERQDWSEDEIRQHVRKQRQVLGTLRRAPVFHIAVVEGVALGWGTEFMLTADYRIACSNASFGLPETGLGIIPGAGGTAELWSIIGVSEALRLGMSGETIGPEEAQRIGLVQRTADSLETGLKQARELADKVCMRSPTANAAFKRGVLESVGRRDVDRIHIESEAYEHCLHTGEAARGRENFRAIRAGEPVTWGPKVIFEP